jgi:hypothetical protein
VKCESNMEREPSANLENTRDRFMDYIGNPLNGALGASLILEDSDLDEERKSKLTKNLLQCWESIFVRLEKFRETHFTPVGNLTEESIDEMLAFKGRDPLEGTALEEFDSRYWATVSVE